MSQEIQIRLPTPTESKDPAFIQHLADLINKAYNETELNLYKPVKYRTNPHEIKRLLQASHFHLAFAPNNPLPVGSVHTHAVGPGIWDVGLLSVHSDARSSGLGRRLVGHAEGVAVRNGAATMRLELLVPMPPAKHDFKEYLRRWYEKLGYVQVRKASVEEVVPHLVESFNEGLEFFDYGEEA